jgi:hypothetical protein
LVATKASWFRGGVEACEITRVGDGTSRAQGRRVNQTMATDDSNDDFLAAVRRRAQRLLDHVQLDSEAGARGAVHEMERLSAEAEAQGHSDLAETARDALAQAWSWRLGRETMDARVRLARLASQLVRESGKAWRS